MKRYLLFITELYYPAGGWNDFAASADTVDELTAGIRSRIAANPRWEEAHVWHVVDLETGCIVSEDT